MPKGGKHGSCVALGGDRVPPDRQVSLTPSCRDALLPGPGDPLPPWPTGAPALPASHPCLSEQLRPAHLQWAGSWAGLLSPSSLFTPSSGSGSFFNPQAHRNLTPVLHALPSLWGKPATAQRVTSLRFALSLAQSSDRGWKPCEESLVLLGLGEGLLETGASWGLQNLRARSPTGFEHCSAVCSPKGDSSP